MRSCYSGTWNLPVVGTVRGYYYFRPWGTPFFEDWNYLGSRNWHAGDGTPWPEFGEKEHSRQVWRDGSFAPDEPPDITLVGTPQCLSSENPPIERRELVSGVDRRCWQGEVTFTRSVSGGIKLGKSSQHSDELESYPLGGIEVGGSASYVVEFNPSGEGGVELGGTSTWALEANRSGQGGLELGGTSTWALEANRSGQGGLELGGTSTWALEANRSGQGGLEIGGTVTRIWNGESIGRGGLKFNGTATHAHTP